MSFEEHIKLEHNIWNYLYFIVLVREKNKTDYTGPESYVAHMIKVRTQWAYPAFAMSHDAPERKPFSFKHKLLDDFCWSQPP